MKKTLLLITIIVSVLNIVACKDNIKQDEVNQNVDSFLQNEQEQQEDIVSNTVYYGIANDNNSSENIENRQFETIVSCQDCFHNIGFAEKICEQDGTYYFERHKNDYDEYELFDWYVYIFNEKQKYKDVKEYNKPVLTNDGKIDLKKGQYLYILCSYNPDTQVVPSNSDQTYTYYMK